MGRTLDDVIASLPADEQAAIEARYQEHHETLAKVFENDKNDEEFLSRYTAWSCHGVSR